MSPTPQSAPEKHDPAGALHTQMFKWIGIFMLGSFALGLTFAGLENIFEDPTSTRYWIIAAIGAFVLSTTGYFGWRMTKRSAAEPLSKSERGGNRLLLISALFGAVIAVAVMLGTSLTGSEADLFSNAPLPPVLAAIVIAAWLVLMPWITLSWFKTVDEHERETYNFGALVALHLYAVIAPAWWLGWRGGFLPEPQHMLLYLGVMTIWCVGWLWRRLR